MPIQKTTLTKQEIAKMLYEINCYTNKGLSESFAWDADTDSGLSSAQDIADQWLDFLKFMQVYFPAVFGELVNGKYIASAVPQSGYDTSMYAYYDALIGHAHWAPKGQKPRTNLPRLSHSERDQYEIISAYLATHQAVANEVKFFYDDLNDQDMQNYTKTIQTSFDIFWKQNVSFDATQKGCSIT